MSNGDVPYVKYPWSKRGNPVPSGERQTAQLVSPVVDGVYPYGVLKGNLILRVLAGAAA
jgi:hypothetical protein